MYTAAETPDEVAARVWPAIDRQFPFAFMGSEAGVKRLVADAVRAAVAAERGRQPGTVGGP